MNVNPIESVPKIYKCKFEDFPEQMLLKIYNQVLNTIQETETGKKNIKYLIRILSASTKDKNYKILHRRLIKKTEIEFVEQPCYRFNIKHKPLLYRHMLEGEVAYQLQKYKNIDLFERYLKMGRYSTRSAAVPIEELKLLCSHLVCVPRDFRRLVLLNRMPALDLVKSLASYFYQIKNKLGNNVDDHSDGAILLLCLIWLFKYETDTTFPIYAVLESFADIDRHLIKRVELCLLEILKNPSPKTEGAQFLSEKEQKIAFFLSQVIYPQSSFSFIMEFEFDTSLTDLIFCSLMYSLRIQDSKKEHQLDSFWKKYTEPQIRDIVESFLVEESLEIFFKIPGFEAGLLKMLHAIVLHQLGSISHQEHISAVKAVIPEMEEQDVENLRNFACRMMTFPESSS